MTLIPQGKPPSIDDDLEDDGKPTTNGHAPKKTAGKKPAAKADKKSKPTAKTSVKKTPKVKAEKKAVSLKDLEAALVKKYPDQNIVPNSLKGVGAVEGHGSKRTIEIKCGNGDCGKKRRIATSDLHQTRYCLPCTKEVRQSRRSDKPKAKKTTKVKASGGKKKSAGRVPVAAGAAG